MTWPLVIGTSGVTAGCGTIFHNERVGMPHSNQLDWKIVALDALGLILFFIPGVIAFVVDFSTGAIYLPPEYCAPVPHFGGAPSHAGAPAAQVAGLRRVEGPQQQLDQARIEQIVSEHSGQEIHLAESTTRVSRLAALDHFGEQRTRHERDRTFGQSVKRLWDRLTPA
jgi:hypothetical protein